MGRAATPAAAPSMSASSTRASTSTTPTSPPTSGPTRSTRSTASTTTATATSTTSTAGTSSSDDNTVYDGSPSDYARHTARTSPAPSARRRQRHRRRRRQLERHDHLRQVPRPQRRHTADAITAVDYLTDLKMRHGLNIVATNNSWGGGGFSQALLDAIIRAAKAGILFIAAAGNGGSTGSATTTTPRRAIRRTTTRRRDATETAAAYDAVIAVAAITSTGALARFSNYGAATVDIGAPGFGICSTLPTNTLRLVQRHLDGDAARHRRRSPCTPRATRPRPPQQIRSAILGSASRPPRSPARPSPADG